MRYGAHPFSVVVVAVVMFVVVGVVVVVVVVVAAAALAIAGVADRVSKVLRVLCVSKGFYGFVKVFCCCVFCCC